MKNSSRKYYIIAMLVLVLIVVVVLSIQKSKTNANIKLNEEQTKKLTSEYNKKKEEFVKIASDLENNISVIILDGTVVDDTTLEEKISEINMLLEKEEYAKFSVYEINPFRGKFYLNSQGKLRYKFTEENLIPNWTKDEDVTHYFV